jgi:hypothetical protein
MSTVNFTASGEESVGRISKIKIVIVEVKKKDKLYD